MVSIKTGITLCSLGTPYLKGELDLEGVIRSAAEMGAEGYEIVASQMITSYPYVSDEFVAFINQMKEKYGIGPICYGTNMDRGMLKDRDLTEDEMVARAITDIISANKLGCTVMREQYLLSPNGLKRIAPYAEAYNVKVGIEIHNPDSPITQPILDYLKVIEETGSKYIGFVPDFGCFATAPNKPYWDRALAAGAPVEALEQMAQLRYDEVPQDEAMALSLHLHLHRAVEHIQKLHLQVEVFFLAVSGQEVKAEIGVVLCVSHSCLLLHFLMIILPQIGSIFR